MKRHSVIAFALIALGTSAPAFAVAPPAPRVKALEQADARFSMFAGQTKGGAQQRMLLERERVRGMLDDLNAGRAVDPGDIDRALQRAEHPF